MITKATAFGIKDQCKEMVSDYPKKTAFPRLLIMGLASGYRAAPREPPHVRGRIHLYDQKTKEISKRCVYFNSVGELAVVVESIYRYWGTA